MKNVIAIFTYNQKKYVIKFVEEKTIGFFKINDLGNLSEQLTLEERRILKKVFSSLNINFEKCNFFEKKQIGNNKYTIFRDNKSLNYYWILENGEYNLRDNIILNFKYNHEPNIIYNTDNKKSFSNINNMFNKIVKIGKKYILVFVSSTIILSSLSGCTVVDNTITNTTEISAYTQNQSTESQFPILESDEEEISKSFPEDTLEVIEEYNYEEIKSIIESNNNLTEEEKEFLNNLQFVFDEYHEYMNLKFIKERLQTLDIEYQEIATPFDSGRYIVNENKIVIEGSSCFKETRINVILHEFMHVLQSGRYKYFTNELSNEFFTREVFIRLYNEGILSKEEFLTCKKADTEILNINDDEEYLKEILGQRNFMSGYMYHMSVYYILAEILPKEVLCSYQFNPEKIEILKNGLVNVGGSSSKEEIERANTIINHINNLREIDIEKNDYVYLYPEEEIFNELDYYYKKSKGRNIKEDLLVNLRMVNYEIFSIYHFDIYDTKYYEEIIKNLTLFLQENQELDYFSSTSLVDKTILSNSQKNAIIMGFLNSGEPTSIIIDDELQEEYFTYIKNIESIQHSTKK